ncbi:MAG: right-handed parallel beta-helix repeat-containing protein [Thermosphaera sp.]
MYYLVKTRLLLLLLLLIGLTALGCARITHGRTINVPGDYPEIQAAVDNAERGDIIIVSRGVYMGFTVSKSLTIIGTSPAEVVVNGRIVVEADDVHISSLKVLLENPTSGLDSAVKLFGRGIVLANIIVESGASGVQVGDASRTEGVVSLESVQISAGGAETYGTPSGVWGVCNSLTITYSTIQVSNGIGVSGCGNTDIFSSSISAGKTALKIGAGTVKSSVISSTNENAVTLTGSNAFVEENEITGKIGIDIPQTSLSSNEIRGNKITGSDIGVRLVGRYNIIHHNTISGNHAIQLHGDYNQISYNYLSGGRGVHAANGHGNTISFNLVNMTGWVGIYMSEYTSENLIFGNTFWYCYNYNAADDSGFNQWYLENETHRVGNYWYDHTGPDADSDGIVDQPYIIPSSTGKQSVDKYPLANPIIPPYASLTATTSSTTTLTTYSPTTTSTETSQTSMTEQEAPGGETITYVAISAIILLMLALILLFKKVRR